MAGPRPWGLRTRRLSPGTPGRGEKSAAPERVRPRCAQQGTGLYSWAGLRGSRVQRVCAGADARLGLHLEKKRKANQSLKVPKASGFQTLLIGFPSKTIFERASPHHFEFICVSMLNTDVMNAIKPKFKEYEKSFSLEIHIFVLTKIILKFCDISVIKYMFVLILV